jgi:alpha-methylacyl-CoA racemase
VTTRPLAGIRVLDLSRLLPGPFLTMILGDLGADVVKVEDPRLGDYMRVMPPVRGGLGGRFLAVNRGKRSLALDLKAEAGREAFLRLCERADVVVESFRPGVLDKLGVGWAALEARNPRLILCSISGYGQDGPFRDRAGHDLNYIGLAGVLAMTGLRGEAPQMPGVQVADLAGGGLWSATAILAALVGRGATGRGRHLDVSMTEGALALLAAEIGNLECGVSPTRGQEALNGGLACYRVYATADGLYLSVGALEPKFWLAFNEAIGRRGDVGELVGGPDVQERVAAEIAAILASRTRAEWLARLEGKDVCCEPVLELDQLASHPQHAARQVFFEITHPELGPVRQVRTPLGAPEAPRLPPRLGEHSTEVLVESGFDGEEIARLREARVVG